jgi:mono/diheme cytochrome c family protein
VRALLAVAPLLAACHGALPSPDLERMLDQPSLRPYEASARFADGRAMRPPPDGTIPHHRLLGQPALTDGVVAGRYVDRIPLAVDRALLQRGRNRFDIFCGVCHGLAGDAVAEVSVNMSLRRPPSLVSAPVTAFPPGRIFQVISLGYGLMPSYAQELPVRDRWAVTAYLQALQLSAGTALASLPPDVRDEARRALEGR